MQSSQRISIIIAAIAGIALFGGIVWFAVTHPFGGEDIVPIASEAPKDFEKIAIDEKVAGELRSGFREQYMKTFDETVVILKEHPDSVWGWLDLGAIKKMFGDYRGAEVAWLYAATLAPTHEAAYANLGDLYRYFLVDYKKAEAALLTLTEVQPTATRAYRDLAEMYRTQYTEKKGDAFLILEKGISQNPDAGDLMAVAALFYEQDGNYKKAIEWLERAKKFLPTNPTIEEDIKRLKRL
ncbi:MAG: tetratricopeptide repeat protein [Candidatus Sungbacteria bacterium]|nr:tetratricopeptide repeat protein [Candidatus Sungbacteria bacterium]